MKKMLFALLVLCTVSFTTMLHAQQTSLSGQVFDGDLNETLFGATVKVLSGGKLIKGMPTDFEGKFRFMLPPGVYELEFSFTGMKTEKITGIDVKSIQETTIICTLEANTDIIPYIHHCNFDSPRLIDFDPSNTGQTITQQSPILKTSKQNQ